MRKFNFTIVFDLGFEKAYLSRVTDCRGNESFQRSKEYEFGYHEFKDADGFKASVKRYTERYGCATKVILNGDHIDGYQAETLCEFIVNEVL